MFENYGLLSGHFCADDKCVITSGLLETKIDKIPELFKSPSVNEVYKHTDTDSNTKISFKELVMAYNLKIEFDRLNVDNKESLTDLDLNSEYTWPEVKRVFTKFDKNGDPN